MERAIFPFFVRPSAQKNSTATRRSGVDQSLVEWWNQRWALPLPININQILPLVCSIADVVLTPLWKVSMQWHGGTTTTCHCIGRISTRWVQLLKRRTTKGSSTDDDAAALLPRWQFPYPSPLPAPKLPSELLIHNKPPIIELSDTIGAQDDRAHRHP